MGPNSPNSITQSLTVLYGISTVWVQTDPEQCHGWPATYSNLWTFPAIHRRKNGYGQNPGESRISLTARNRLRGFRSPPQTADSYRRRRGYGNLHSNVRGYDGLASQWPQQKRRSRLHLSSFTDLRLVRKQLHLWVKFRHSFVSGRLCRSTAKEAIIFNGSKGKLRTLHPESPWALQSHHQDVKLAPLTVSWLLRPLGIIRYASITTLALTSYTIPFLLDALSARLVHSYSIILFSDHDPNVFQNWHSLRRSWLDQHFARSFATNHRQHSLITFFFQLPRASFSFHHNRRSTSVHSSFYLRIPRPLRPHHLHSRNVKFEGLEDLRCSSGRI